MMFSVHPGYFPWDSLASRVHDNYNVLYSRIGPIISGPAECAMPWVLLLLIFNLEALDKLALAIIPLYLATPLYTAS